MNKKITSLVQQLKKRKENISLINAMHHYDYTLNISWVMTHYNAAKKYIGANDDEATGGSDWRKYMHPKYQKRIFFPDLWYKNELEIGELQS